MHQAVKTTNINQPGEKRGQLRNFSVNVWLGNRFIKSTGFSWEFDWSKKLRQPAPHDSSNQCQGDRPADGGLNG
jgi:hypothetical protein